MQFDKNNFIFFQQNKSGQFLFLVSEAYSWQVCDGPNIEINLQKKKKNIPEKTKRDQSSVRRQKSANPPNSRHRRSTQTSMSQLVLTRARVKLMRLIRVRQCDCQVAVSQGGSTQKQVVLYFNRRLHKTFYLRSNVALSGNVLKNWQVCTLHFHSALRGGCRQRSPG